MRITQSYDGTVSHKPHTTGTPKDYPLDEGCDDTGRSWAFCPCDEMKVVRIYGVGNRGTNTIWLTSTSKVELANGKKDFVTILFTHPNDDDLKNIKLNQKFKRGEKLFREGADGASGNHLHISVGLGEMKGNGWVKNSNNKYVIYTTNGAIKPEEAFFIDESFTTIKNKKSLKFKALPKIKKETYRVEASKLNCRSGAGTSYKIVTSFLKGTKIEISQSKTADGYTWGKCDKGWVALEYCRKI